MRDYLKLNFYKCLLVSKEILSVVLGIKCDIINMFFRELYFYNIKTLMLDVLLNIDLRKEMN